MKYLLALFVLAACTTERNPDVCCTTDADCARLGGIPPTGCADGFVCTNFVCVAAACTADTDCAAGAPVCDLATATCAACTSSSDCDGYADAPVCDTASGGCRACQLDAECASDVCDVDTGRCVAEADVIYASATGADTATCTLTNPCSTTRAIVVASADPAPSIVRMLPGTYGTPIIVSSGSTTIFGSGAKLAPALSVFTAVEARDTANLEIRGLDIDRGTSGADAAFCGGAGSLFPTLTLRESTIRGTINAVHGKARLHRSVVSDITPASIGSDGTLEADQTRLGSPSSGLLRTLGERMTVRITNSVLERVTLAMANSDVAPDKSEYYIAFSTFVLDAASSKIAPTPAIVRAWRSSRITSYFPRDRGPWSSAPRARSPGTSHIRRIPILGERTSTSIPGSSTQVPETTGCRLVARPSTMPSLPRGLTSTTTSLGRRVRRDYGTTSERSS